MDTKQDISPTPWHIDEAGNIIAADGNAVCLPERRPHRFNDRARIVRAVNSYEAMREALQIAAVIAREQINRAPADSDAEAGAIADHRIITDALALADGKAVTE